MAEHPTWQELEHEEPKRTEWMRHLLKRCRHCLRSVTTVVEPYEPDESAARWVDLGQYDQAFQRATRRARKQTTRLEEARGRARSAAALLTSRSALTFEFLDEHEKVIAGPIWVETLLEKSFAERYGDLEKMVDFAEMAVNYARNLNAETFGEPAVVDAQVRAKAELANAYRLMDRFDAAARLFHEVGDLLDRSSEDPLLLARVFELNAALLANRRYLSEACELLDSTVTIYKDLGQRHLAGRALSILALYTDYLGRHAEALALIRDAVARIDREKDPQLAATSAQLLIWCLAENGEYREANRLLLASGLREKLAGEPFNLLKLRWVEGQIWAGLGKLERAESALAEVHKGFDRAGQVFRTALVGLDLAAVWLAQGKNTEVRDLAKEMLETFRDVGAARENRRALEYFYEASAREQATPGLAHQVRRFLQRAEHQSGLCFEAG